MLGVSAYLLAAMAVIMAPAIIIIMADIPIAHILAIRDTVMVTGRIIVAAG